MASVLVRFYAELGDLLPAHRRGRDFRAPFSSGGSVKDLIEGLGVPHTEVDLILVDGRSVDFRHPLADGERVSVFPVFEALDISGLTRVRSAPLRDPRFVADVHLGRLSSYLRLAGFDTLYGNDWSDEEIVDVALSERRTILTRDRGLLKRGAVTHGYLVRATESRLQLQEVVDRFDLGASMRPFSRCSACNGVVEPVAKAEIEAELPAHTGQTQHEFCRCRQCGRLYWKGTHHQAITRLLASLASAADAEAPSFHDEP
jgi:uncharacterized protein